MGKLRILVVDDSLTMRKHIAAVLGADPSLEVVGEAADGKEAIDLCRTLRPDVITLDMMMPGTSGMAVTEHVMAYFPTPILVVSASTNRGELFNTYEALAAGAVDVLEKPSGTEPDDAWERQLISAVKVVSRVRVITHIRGRLGSFGRTSTPNPTGLPAPAAARKRTRIIAIGASTGGPGAIRQILRALPANFPIPILLVMHIGQPFGAAFADWLDEQSRLPVRWAEDGEPLPAVGKPLVALAPPDRHLAVGGGRLRLTADAERHSCRPSVDVLFESLAAGHGHVTAACLLTGMGKDGAKGLLALRQARARTFAQDESSSIIFGMPKEAIQIGAAEHVLPLDEMGPALLKLADDGEGD